jgi:hypothetical protein
MKSNWMWVSYLILFYIFDKRLGKSCFFRRNIFSYRFSVFILSNWRARCKIIKLSDLQIHNKLINPFTNLKTIYQSSDRPINLVNRLPSLPVDQLRLLRLRFIWTTEYSSAIDFLSSSLVEKIFFRFNPMVSVAKEGQVLLFLWY